MQQSKDGFQVSEGSGKAEGMCFRATGVYMRLPAGRAEYWA